MGYNGMSSLAIAMAFAALHRKQLAAESDKDVVHTKTVEIESEPLPAVETRQQRRARERREAKAARRTEGRKP